MRMRKVAVGLITFIFTYTACGPATTMTADGYPVSAYEAAGVFFSQTRVINVEIAYEPGAVPYTGTVSSGLQAWQILKDNIKALYQGRSIQPVINVPTDFSGMTQIPSQNKSSWTKLDIYNVGDKYRKLKSNDAESDFIIVFLKGYYNDGTATQTSVIGVSVGGTTVVGIFKDVITASGSSGGSLGSDTAKYVEQSTMVHELGHALGLVNNGLPMKAPHVDHSTHCTNPNCVMYWQNQGTASLQAFVNKLKAGSDVMYGPECLQDAQQY